MRRLMLAAGLLAACSKDIHNQEAVRQSVIRHLSERKNLDLDLSKMDVSVTSVSFRQNEADATISFSARGSQASLMTMNYTLERKENVWVVKTKAESGSPHGAGNAAHPEGLAPSQQLPPGHPPVEPPSKGAGK